MNRALLVALLGWMASPVLACSGPGAAEAIARAEWAGWGLLGLAVVMVLAANLRARRLGVGGRSMAAGWILIFAHPGIWMSARSGDCGATRLESSLLFTALAAGLGLWGMLRSGPDPQDDGDRSPRP